MGSVPTPLDWVANAGNFATATMLQDGVGTPLDFLLDPPGAQVRRTTAQAISAGGSGTAIIFDTEDSDNDTMHATNGTKLFCNTPGRFLVSGSIPYDTATSGAREIRLTKNGASLVPGGRIAIPATASVASVVLPATEVALAVGDFLELVAFSGTAVNTLATNGLFPVFRARWIGP
jgi:hypothetical protein